MSRQQNMDVIVSILGRINQEMKESGTIGSEKPTRLFPAPARQLRESMNQRRSLLVVVCTVLTAGAGGGEVEVQAGAIRLLLPAPATLAPS